MPQVGRIKTRPEDFVVDEIPAYEPSGEGPHLYLHIKKKNKTTDDVVKTIAHALDVPQREIGFAGMKDKVAVTTQWISVPAKDAAFDERARALEIEGVQVLEAKRHQNKLKPGHLRGNRFTIIVRGVTDVPSALSSFETIAKVGVPNAFGAQRFGRDGDTAVRARAWLTGKERAPGDPRLRRFHFSAFQSEIFNALLEARVADGSWTVPLLGDLLKKEETGGMFVCTDVQTDRERAAQGEVCPTGPIIGDRMRQPEAEALAYEQRIILPRIEGIDLKRARSLGEGTRRVLRLRVTEMSVAPGEHTGQMMKSSHELDGDLREQEDAITVRFVLPKGAYATTVLSSVFHVIDAIREHEIEEE
jgi:tRNA pseudouridine13 synthase